MGKRSVVAIAVFVLFAFGVTVAVLQAGTRGAELMFNSAAWVLFAAPFAGLFAAGFTKREDPRVEGDRVLRHDGPAILQHWTHGLGTAVLLGTGVILGLLFIPSALPSGQAVWTAMNVHYVAAVMFLFGTFYYLGNTWISSHRFVEHLPNKESVGIAIQHYGHLLGAKQFAEAPREGKYFESERIAYVMAVVATVTMVVTGLFKALAHVVDIPALVMGPMTLLHDAGTVLMLLFFAAHVFFGAILPNAWPGLRSMFTGYVPLDYAEKEHVAWVEQLEGEGAPK